MTWAPGRTGGAIQLERDGWLECPRSASLARPSVELSVAAWVRLPGGRTGVQTVLARQQAADVHDDFFLGFFAHTPMVDELVVNSRTWETRVDAPLFRARGRWIHVAATHTSAAPPRCSWTASQSPPAGQRAPRRRCKPPRPSSSEAAPTGPNPARVNQLFDGELDELLVYERALAPEEIEALAAGRRP